MEQGKNVGKKDIGKSMMLDADLRPGERSGSEGAERMFESRNV